MWSYFRDLIIRIIMVQSKFNLNIQCKNYEFSVCNYVILQCYWTYWATYTTTNNTYACKATFSFLYLKINKISKINVDLEKFQKQVPAAPKRATWSCHPSKERQRLFCNKNIYIQIFRDLFVIKIFMSRCGKSGRPPVGRLGAGRPPVGRLGPGMKISAGFVGF